MSAPAPSVTETPKQRLLSHRLAEGGYPHGWRRYLVERREQGKSQTDVAWELRERYQVTLDPSTVSKWGLQARQETSAKRRTEEKAGGRKPKATEK